jgi:SAM-dependent methyltransferase
MIREVFHFLRHAPATLKLKKRLSQAELYDTLMDRADAAGLGARRDALVDGLHGDILEIGAGTGRMFGRYAADARVTAIEPEAAFRERSVAPAEASPARITVVDGTAEKLPFPDASFDAVVVCLVLCSVGSVPQVLGELRRVLRPGGELRLVEHVRSDRVVAGFLMRAFNWLWRLLNGQGCNRSSSTARACRRSRWSGSSRACPEVQHDPATLVAAHHVRRADHRHRLRLRHPSKLHRRRERADHRLRDDNPRGVRDVCRRASRRERTAEDVTRPSADRASARLEGRVGRRGEDDSVPDARTAQRAGATVVYSRTAHTG